MKFDREHLGTLAAGAAGGTFDAAGRQLSVTLSVTANAFARSSSSSAAWSLCARSRSGRPSLVPALPRLAQQLVVPVVVNADSMATWLLPALAEVAARHPVAGAPSSRSAGCVIARSRALSSPPAGSRTEWTPASSRAPRLGGLHCGRRAGPGLGDAARPAGGCRPYRGRAGHPRRHPFDRRPAALAAVEAALHTSRSRPGYRGCARPHRSVMSVWRGPGCDGIH